MTLNNFQASHNALVRQLLQKQDEIMVYNNNMNMHAPIAMKSTSKCKDIDMHATIKP